MQRLYHSAERFVPKRFLELLNREHFEDVQLGDGVKKRVSILFADIRGFTTLSESLTPEQVTTFLNTYTHHMLPIIQKCNGFINQFLGDGILALFPESPSDAVDAAIGMAQELKNFNSEIEHLKQIRQCSPKIQGVNFTHGVSRVAESRK